MKKIFYLFVLILFLMTFNACHYTDIVPGEGGNVEISEDISYANTIEPIFKTQSCTNCHPTMKKPDLTAGNSYASLTDGEYLNTKKPEKSELLIVAAPEGEHAAKLTSAQVELIIAWIDQGAKDN